MDLPQLTDEQLQQVQEFFTSDAAHRLFERLEAMTMADWILAEEPVEREKCWHALHAVLNLQTTLRDATANKRLSERSQNVRATNFRTGDRTGP